MENMTMQLIHALKNPGEGKPEVGKYNFNGKYHQGILEETAIDFLSDLTDTPAEFYTDVIVERAAINVFIDYLRTADNPAFDVWQYFEFKKYGACDSDVIFQALQLTKVRNDKGEYVNGFKEVKKDAC